MEFESTTIPNMTGLRQGKPGYEERCKINTGHPLHNDWLVDMREFDGFADASSYYAKPNRMTGEPLPGVPDAPFVRHDVARRLMRVNQYLSTDPDVAEALGAPARIRVDDALRPHRVQVMAFYEAWPKIIAQTNPEMSPEEVLAAVPKYCAKPGDDQNLKPTPHLTGGAVDVALINLATGEPFNRGHEPGAVQGTAFPDFHEGYHLEAGQSDIENSEIQEAVADRNSEIVIGRRVLYYAMTHPGIGGLVVNPNEIWHYGIGDPLSAYVTGTEPYYGIVELPNDFYGQ